MSDGDVWTGFYKSDESTDNESTDDDESTDDESTDTDTSTKEGISDTEGENGNEQEGNADVNKGEGDGENDGEDDGEDDEKDALIVFDYDDSIFPTSFLGSVLTQEQLDNLHPLQVSEDIHVLLETTQKKVVSLLKYACDLGDVMILTNGSEDWVNHSANSFMPDLKACLDNTDEHITVVSARDRHEQNHPGNGQMWKNLAFKEEVEEYIEDSTPTSENFSLVSIGDGQFERQAALLMESVIPKDCIKIMKLEAIEEIVDFTKQVERIDNIIESTIDSQNHLDMEI